jgi:hypothetical protein
MKRLINSAIILFLIMSFLPTVAFAQDNHYSWMQFGSRNSILYNAGISRFEDQSAVIMNPATLSAATTSSFNFNTNAIGFNNISFKNGLGQGYNITNSNFNILPSMASGVLKPKKKERDWVLGYALFHSTHDKLNFNDRAETRLNIINETESPGDENYLAQYQLQTELDETSVVAGVGWDISKDLSLGFSQTFVYRSQEYRDNFSANVITDIGSPATVDLVSTGYDVFTKYWKILTYSKLGMNYTRDKWNLGLVLTLPSLGIMGTGEMTADLSLTNIRLIDDLSIPRKNYLASGRFEKLKVKYKTPWNIGLGASKKFGKVMWYGGVNFYSAIKEYSIMDPGTGAFIQPPSSENVLYTSQFLRVWDARRNVVNGSIAADWILRPDYHLLFSFRNDNYYTVSDREKEGFNMTKKRWNNYHLTFGTQRDFGSSEWVIGLRLNAGRNKEFPQPFSFTDPAEDNFFQGERKTGTINSTGLQLLLSYTFKFGQK